VTAARGGLENILLTLEIPQTILSLLATQPRFLGRPTRSPVTVPTELSWLLLTVCYCSNELLGFLSARQRNAEQKDILKCTAYCYQYVR